VRPRGLAALAATSRYFKGIQALSAPSFAEWSTRRCTRASTWPITANKGSWIRFHAGPGRRSRPDPAGFRGRAGGAAGGRTDGFACEPRVETCGWAGPGSTRSAAEKNGKSPRRSSCGARTKRASGWGVRSPTAGGDRPGLELLHLPGWRGVRQYYGDRGGQRGLRLRRRVDRIRGFPDCPSGSERQRRQARMRSWPS